MPLSITRQRRKLIIELPMLRKPTKSKNDPSKLVLAGTRGEMPTELLSGGHNIIVKVSVFTRPSVPEYKHRAQIALLKAEGKLV